jgi:hypothetical protein
MGVMIKKSKFPSQRNEEQINFGKCLLPSSSKSLSSHPLFKTLRLKNIQNYN